MDGATKQFGADDPLTAGVTAPLGLNLLRQHKDEEAEPLLRECLAVHQKNEPDAWTTFNTQSMLGGSLLGQKKYEEAEPLLLAGYEGMEKRADKIPLQSKFRCPRRRSGWCSCTTPWTARTRRTAGARSWRKPSSPRSRPPSRSEPITGWRRLPRE